MKFVAIEPDEIDELASGARHGSVSYPILKEFVDSGMYMAKLDKSEFPQDYSSLSSSVGGYIRRHHLPIKMFARNNDVYFQRLDIDKHGNPIPDWDKEQRIAAQPVVDLRADMVRQQLLQQAKK
jgi:hypothetical protein